MHRSGTSVATRLVNLLGVPTCLESDLFAAEPDNPRGNWECRSLTEFNDRLLGALGSDWTCPPLLEAEWERDPALEPVYVEAWSVFPRIITSEQWVWKDPRNCVLLPFWVRLLAVEPVIVLLHREPLEVAASLRLRDGLGLELAVALWERYTRLALAAIAGRPTLVAEFATIRDNPQQWISGLGDFLARAGVRTSPARLDDVLAFVERDRRSAPGRNGPPLSDAQVALASALVASSGAHEAFVTPELPPETPATEALLAERRRLMRANPSWAGA
jgi:hypothetical protein